MEKSMLKFLPLIMRGRSYFWPNKMVDSLKALYKGPKCSQVHSGEALFDFIVDARQEIGLEKEYLQRNSGNGYSLFFDDLMSRAEAKQWFEDTLPSLAGLLLRFPDILEKHYAESGQNSAAGVETSLRILYPQQPGIVLLSQELAAALLACALFCLFPVDQRRRDKLPNINFDGLFAQQHKMRCLINYFQRVSREMPAGAVSFERKVIPLKADTFPLTLPSGDFWSQSKEPLCEFEVSETGGIEGHCREALEVDFANEYLGGGALSVGCVQEEIRFMINPELIAGMLFLPCMEHNESIEIVGAERFSNYEGYASGFRFAGNFIDQKRRNSFGRRETRIVAIDALCYPGEKQFEFRKVCREVNKAFCGFLDHAQLRGYFNLIKAAKMKHGLCNNTNASRTEDKSTLMEPYAKGKEPKISTNEQLCHANAFHSTGIQVQDHRNFDTIDETIEPINKVKDDKGKEMEQIGCLHVPADGIGISTGNWGCGAFGGDVELKSMLQWIAASKALRPFVLYFTFGEHFAGRLRRVTEWIKSHSWTIGELWDTLLEYSRQRLARKTHDNFFDWLLPLINEGQRKQLLYNY